MNAAKWKKALLEATRGGTYINPDEAKELAELLPPEPSLGEAGNRGNMISIIQGAPYLVEINGGGWGFGYWSEKRGDLHCIHPRGHSFVRQNENVFAIDEKWLPPLPALVLAEHDIRLVNQFDAKTKSGIAANANWADRQEVQLAIWCGQGVLQEV